MSATASSPIPAPSLYSGGSGLFPTATTGGNNDRPRPLFTNGTMIFPPEASGGGGGGGRNNGAGGTSNVYYLVFLGVLLALILLAAGLTYRSYRIRMRYRTATQMAIARGEDPARWWGDSQMGMWGAPFRAEMMDGWAPVRTARRERTWMPIPKLYDAVPEPPDVDEKDEKGKGPPIDLWDEVQPLSIQSLLPRPTNPDPAPPAPAAPEAAATAAERIRNASHSFRVRMGFEMAPPAPEPVPPPPQPSEAERTLEDGEPVQVAVIVQMPGYDSARMSMLSDDEEVGWQPGMEIGVWEGSVRQSSKPTPRSSMSDSDEFHPASAYLDIRTPHAGFQTPHSGAPTPHHTETQMPASAPQFSNPFDRSQDATPPHPLVPEADMGHSKR